LERIEGSPHELTVSKLSVSSLITKDVLYIFGPPEIGGFSRSDLLMCG